jgi:hypothetical protein
MKVLLVIYSCCKYSFMHNYYIEKYKNMGYDVFVVYGDNALDNEYEIDYENNFIKLNCNDSFEYLVNKTNLLLNVFLLEFSDYDYLIKMDDDTEINIDHDTLSNLDIWNNDYMGHKLIKSEPKEHNYHFGKCNDNALNIKPYDLEIDLSWGAGYFYILSRTIIKTLCEDIKNYPDLLNENLYEDMLIGYMMLNNNINFIEVLTYDIITNLNRPRMTSITNLLSANINKVMYNNNSKKIKKISINYNKSENDVDEKLKRELSISDELTKKIEELQQKVRNTNFEKKHINEEKQVNFDNNTNLKNITTKKVPNKQPIRKIIVKKN